MGTRGHGFRVCWTPKTDDTSDDCPLAANLCVAILVTFWFRIPVAAPMKVDCGMRGTIALDS